MIIGWQGPYAMHVFGQHNPGIDMKRVTMADVFDDTPQQFNFMDQ